MLVAMRNRGLNKLIHLKSKPTEERDENAVKERLDRYMTVFDQSPISAQLYDSEGRLERMNRSCLDMLGVVNQEELIGSNLFYDPSIPAEARSQLLGGQAVRTECDIDFDLANSLSMFQTTRTGVRRLDMSITPLRSTEGLSGYLAQIQDITEQEPAENGMGEPGPINHCAAATESEDTARKEPHLPQAGVFTDSREHTDFRLPDSPRVLEKLRAALEMAGKVCHQLNQPLQIILTNAELMLERGNHDTKTRKSLDSIKAQIHRMATMTGNLISVKEYATREENTDRR